MEQFTEADIAAIGVEYLKEKGWVTYPEVVIPIFGGRPDLVATKGGFCLVAEVKKSLSYQVIEQLVRWHIDYETVEKSTYMDKRVLAIPHLMVAMVPGGQSISALKREILERYRIGVLGVYNEYDAMPFGTDRQEVLHEGKRWKVIEEIQPKIQCGSRKTGFRIIEHLHEDMRCAVPGSSGKAGGYMTPYKRTMGTVWHYISQQPLGTSVHLSGIVEYLNRNSGHHYANDRSALGGIIDALTRDGVVVSGYRIAVPDKSLCQEMHRKYPTIIKDALPMVGSLV